MVNKVNIIICGLGGQGILFITKIISYTALKMGYKVLAAETHGMAQRGGSVISHLKIGNPISSLIGFNDADYILSLDENEAYRNILFLSPGSSIFTNVFDNVNPPKLIKEYCYKQNIGIKIINGENITKKFSAPLSLNMVILGFFFSFYDKLFSKEDIIRTIKEISPMKFKENNLNVFNNS